MQRGKRLAAHHRSPTLASARRPPHRSIGSPLRRGLAPSAVHAWATVSASSAPDSHPCGLVGEQRALQTRRAADAHDRRMRPCRRPGLRSLPRNACATRARAAARARRRARPAGAAASPGPRSATPARWRTRSSSGGPWPASVSSASATSSALPTARPSGCDMSLTTAAMCRPAAAPMFDHRLRQLPRSRRARA